MATIQHTAAPPEFGGLVVHVNDDEGTIDYTVTTVAQSPEGPLYYEESDSHAAPAALAATFASILSHHITALRTAGYSFPGDTLA